MLASTSGGGLVMFRVNPFVVVRCYKSKPNNQYELVSEYVGMNCSDAPYCMVNVIDDKPRPMEIPSTYLGRLNLSIDEPHKIGSVFTFGSRRYRVMDRIYFSASLLCLLDLPGSRFRVLVYQARVRFRVAFWRLMHRLKWIKKFDPSADMVSREGFGWRYLRPFGLWRDR
jgi:hypothetical protein